MIPHALTSFVLRAIAAIALALAASAANAAPPQRIAIVDVDVVPMDRERVLTGQTVLVEDGVITALGRDVALPAGTRVIQGAGRFLSPGLADMHSHAQSREEMKVYLASGVTTVLNLGGAGSDFMGQRVPLLNRAERPGPHVYAALRIDGSPRFGQFVVTTADEARWAVRLARANGYRFVKVYSGLSEAAFAAAADEARRLGLGIVGHNIDAVRIPGQLAAGQSLVAHLEELLYGLYTPPEDEPLAAPDDAFIEEAVDLVRRHGAYVVADLHTFETIAAQWGRPDVVAGYLAEPGNRLVPFEWRMDWRRQGYVNKAGSLSARAAFMARLVKALGDANVGLLAGTDAPTIPGIGAGASLHVALDRLEAAGLSRYQALATATQAPGRYISAVLGDAPAFGQVQPGFRADLVLSDANPLHGLETLRTPAGVMRKGHWYGRAELDALLDEVREDYSAVRCTRCCNGKAAVVRSGTTCGAARPQGAAAVGLDAMPRE